jgi:bacterioferritin-associated ferredoxin
MFVCACARVSERNLRAAIRAGANTRAEVGRVCGAGIRCGGCLQRIDQLIAQETGQSQLPLRWRIASRMRRRG